ncbi:ABC transporter ATP-binding protein [Robiginitomaculum antarcticum]|uniref:ABC transporter ATP-binding protein n=1 Tax=Robiginitomaculum antarcticum TaxID=437507 RepID=UPI0003731AB4|nr:ATP-binding cassette domain-containing protein [Robiginitomaculum antarcticum]
MNIPPLDISGLTKKFGSKIAVDNVSFSVSEGEIVGFLGPNGAGKTSTLRMALGILPPDSGSAKLFGRAPGPAAFGRVGFLPEERGLYRKSTARGAIAHMARLNGMRGREAFKRADAMMEQYGIGEAKNSKVKALSKGMAQKVQLIAAIAHDPELLILDEPFSGLDPVNQKVLEDIIRGIAARGRTIIFSTHVMEHAERLCDRIICMNYGAKIFDGSVEDALTHAGTRIRLQTEADNARDWLAPMASHIYDEGSGVYHLTLKDGVDSQAVLKACIDSGAALLRFEPEQPSLHDAFVAMVGPDSSRKKEAAA